jgi:hypothetical protein
LPLQFSRKGKNNLLINKFAKVLLIKKNSFAKWQSCLLE